MAKPDPALLDRSRYPFGCSIETRFADVDVNRHINNVAMVGMLEEGRVRFHRASDWQTALDGLTSMVASLTVEFIGQSHFPEPLDMHVAPARIGNTSYVLQQLVTQDGVPVVYAQTVLVCMGANGPQPLPALIRDSAPAWMFRP